MTDPLAHDCPSCQAPAGSRCRRLIDGTARGPHETRVDVARGVTPRTEQRQPALYVAAPWADR